MPMPVFQRLAQSGTRACGMPFSRPGMRPVEQRLHQDDLVCSNRPHFSAAREICTAAPVIDVSVIYLRCAGDT
jgi:hypothetical protein